VNARWAELRYFMLLDRATERSIHPAQEKNEMLVLSRKPGERIVIGENIVLTVLGVYGNKVRLGVEAPRDLSIYREEIHRRRQDASRHEAQEDERALLVVDTIR